MKRFACLLLAAAAGCASASGERAQPAEEREPVDESPGRASGLVDAGPVDICIETGDRELGAYTLVLVYDRTLVRVSRVESTEEFRLPDFSRSGLTSGNLTLSSYSVSAGPTGRTTVARVTFESLRGQSSRLTVRLDKLYDGAGLPVKGRAEASREKVP